jgi:hypothetical protein
LEIESLEKYKSKTNSIPELIKDKEGKEFLKETLEKIDAEEVKLHYDIEFIYNAAAFEKKNQTIYLHGTDFDKSGYFYQKLFVNIDNQETIFGNDGTNDSSELLFNVLNSNQCPSQEVSRFIYKEFAENKYTNIEKWDEVDVDIWKQSILKTKVNDDNIANVISVLKYAAYKNLFNSKYYPRDIQVISVLIDYKSDHGRALQVATGEGKTLITAISSSIKVLNGEKVDISSSSKELAERDAEELEQFYNFLAISSGHIYGNEIDK